MARRGLEAPAALLFIVDNPIEKPNRALDRDLSVAQPLPQVFKRSAFRLVPLELIDPRLECVVTGLLRDGDLLDNRQLLAADGARIESQPKVACDLLGLRPDFRSLPGRVARGLGPALLVEFCARQSDGGERRRTQNGIAPLEVAVHVNPFFEAKIAW